MIPQFMTHENCRIDIAHTSLIDRIEAGLDELIAVFGVPIPGTYNETECEWHIEFDDGVIATIYDYYGQRWCVGGHGLDAVTRIEQLVALHRSVTEMAA